jgi:diaminopimelate epimerase
MSPLADRPFTKMNGLGNEIVVLDLRGTSVQVTPAEARAIGADPRLKFDQMMVLHDSVTPDALALVRIFNIDGTLAEACGNGSRCVAWALAREGAPERFKIETARGLLDCQTLDEWTYAVDMGAPRLGWSEIPLARPTEDTANLDFSIEGYDRPAAANMGNPHVVFFVADVAAVDVPRLGPRIETDPLFPAKVNASFAQVLEPDRVRLRVWERGAGVTQACGSAACATLVGAVRRGLARRKAALELPGGELTVEWRDDDHVMMTGPVEWEFAERFSPALFKDLA